MTNAELFQRCFLGCIKQRSDHSHLPRLELLRVMITDNLPLGKYGHCDEYGHIRISSVYAYRNFATFHELAHAYMIRFPAPIRSMDSEELIADMVAVRLCLRFGYALPLCHFHNRYSAIVKMTDSDAVLGWVNHRSHQIDTVYRHLALTITAHLVTCRFLSLNHLDYTDPM
jgi:hypothetical protein